MIDLDDQTITYLKRVLGKQLSLWDGDWIANRILSQIESYEKRLKEVSECKHKPRIYIGKNKHCSKCGTRGVKGYYET